MRPHSLRLATATALLVGVLGACKGETGPNTPPLPPRVELPQGSEIAPVLYPDEELKTFQLPEGYRIQLVAAEPMVQEPVRMQFDADGRLWVVEMRSYMPDINDTGADEPTGRIVVLEDENDDGLMDKRTVFMDSLVLPRALAVLEQGVIYSSPPNMWLARDTDGDLRADTVELLRDDYGNPGGSVEHNANGFLWGIDNWLHSSEYAGEHRFRDGKLEFRETPSEGQWGISVDEYGRIYRNSNEDPLRIDLVSAHYAARNPNLPSVRGVYERLTDNVAVWPSHKTPGINRGYRPQTMRPDSTLAHYTAANSPTAFVGDRLPKELLNDVFIAEPVGNLVGRLKVEQHEDGIPTASRIDGETDFLTSTDERFRPTYITNAPDGTLYISDMYRGIIQHRIYITGYLHEQIVNRGLAQPIGLGRIFRIVHESMARAPQPHLSDATSVELVPYLSHQNGWYRMTAQRLMVERGDASAAPALVEVLNSGDDDRGRLHALWTLDGLGKVDEPILDTAFADASPYVRAAAVRISEPWLARPANPVTATVLRLVDDPSPIVRWQVAASLGELPMGDRETALANVVVRHGDDALVPDLVVSGLAGRELPFTERLIGAQATETAAPTLEVLASAIMRSGDSDDIASLVKLATDSSRPRWQRLALLSSSSGGGRGGLGRGGGGASVKLAAAPQGLIAMTEGSDTALSARATAIAARLDWPGKPRPEREVRPLTAAEQQEYEAGSKEFAAVCAACHQANGEGMTGVAKSLVGSEWVLGTPPRLIRILLHGKEGEMLMPPLGATMSDSTVAAVLTYVRRSFGNQADPIHAEDVAEIRGATMGRTAPFTEDELRDVRR